jgi:3-hydroxyisobutyrate dehydrogenase-like beta-hydroxyacid dehydrogenase
MPETAVGVIGLGLMGEVYARRLLTRGFAVTGYDIDERKRAAAADYGITPGTTESIARHCDPIVLAVFSTDQVEDVVEKALLPTAAGKIVISTSTCDPDRIAALAARIAGRLRFLEAPVSGSSAQVRDGEGLGLIGGDEGVAAAATPVLDALFPRRFHIGKAGDGARAKLAINHILGLNRLALAEGLVFASRMGLDPEAFLGVARESAAASRIMDNKGGKMIRGDFSAEGRAQQHLKDVRLMLDQARQAGQRLPLLEVHADVLEACVRHGEGEHDNSVVIEEIRRRRQ